MTPTTGSRLGSVPLCALVLLAGPLACSFSKGSESSSDSSTSVSKSSTSSLGAETARFFEDAEQYKAAFFESWRDAPAHPTAGERSSS